MSRKIILIISILICSLSYGQYDWTSGKLILKNGETLKGLIKIPQVTHGLLSFPKNKLEYKKDKKGKKKKFDETQVDKVFFATFDPNLGYYEYVPVSMKRMALFKLVRNGKVKLYVRTIKIGRNSLIPTDNNPFGNKIIEKYQEFYMIRKNETVATRVINESDGISLNLRTFKNYAKKYFSDCPDVLSYIDNDLYEDFDIAQIVDDYNLLCE